MKISHSSICYPSRYTHEVCETMQVHVQIEQNPYELSVETLYEMAARINKKRSFLFVSKVLGKHIPIPPEVPLVASALLASIYYEGKTTKQMPGKEQLIEAVKDGSPKNLQAAYSIVQQLRCQLDEPVVFIGFAETATALGHGVFDCFTDATYIHSTREMLADEEVTLYFEEEHSHATDQRCYAPERYLDNEHSICLVDDEITTGKTALNIIASIEKQFPRKEYTILSLLDWRSEEDQQRLKAFEKLHDIRITTYALLAGTIQVEGTPSLVEVPTIIGDSVVEVPYFKRINLKSLPIPLPHYPYSSIDSFGFKNASNYSALTGRFGISSDNKQDVEAYCQRAGEYLRKYRTGKRTLCLGTGEFMHIPMKTAVYMGEGVSYHSTTRSPIFPINRESYPIKNRMAFESPEDPATMNYAYNVSDMEYDEVFLFFERPIEDNRLEPIVRQFKGLPAIHIVDFT
ncbi:phosphoribosyltransferase family protein [Sporosarcina sp. E16_8]|uniref:phosphoribosyltransferase family protein n=1 Tax=Sporosarcina sp. E16_8 TaxID=2789295 RepID=UPI001A9197F6|nr:phosphoribosyltransferase family protein [Sporosarcina sp. E16_8]MBO0587815.1 phosphoribosyltransferase family protein [Sporosarcina sp. E16_8]